MFYQNIFFLSYKTIISLITQSSFQQGKGIRLLGYRRMFRTAAPWYNTDTTGTFVEYWNNNYLFTITL